jgi:hypothetical protein
MKVQDYEEDAVLFSYVWRQCQHLMTEVELRADQAATVRMKAEGMRSRGHGDLARRMLERWGAPGDLAVDAELRDGQVAFRRRVFCRLLADPRCQALINRCPRCRRVVATPRARQCLWCKHDWHERSTPPGTVPGQSSE